MKTLTKIWIAGAFMLLFTACDFWNDRDVVDYKVNIGTVENADSSSAFYFRLDNNSLLWVKSTNLPNYKPASGQRIIAEYTLASDKRTGGSYDYDIKLYDAYSVLTKNVFLVTPSTQDSIGNDYIRVENVWIGADYLNVQFVYAGYDKIHYINLVSDSSKTYTDGKVHLEFRHNANHDSPIYNRRGYVSFRLKPFSQLLQQDTLQLVIHVNSLYGSSAKTYELKYPVAAGSMDMAAPRKIGMPDGQEKLNR
ncbi:MAG TPA: NigD-like protein [Paludibacter sp.]|nr:NigD-like protein [Paludibacter sp.]